MAIAAALPIDFLQASIEAGVPRFEIEAYNGGLLRVAGFDAPVVVDLASATFVDHQLPILFAHDRSVALGHADQRRNDGRSIWLAGLLSVPGSKRDEIVAAHKSGYRWQASIGAKDFRRQPIGPGQSVTVNGRSFTGPIIVARGATIYETSILPIGADSTTSVSIAAASAADSTEKGKSMTFEEWVKSLGLVLAQLKDEQRNELQAAYDAKQLAANAQPGGQQQSQQQMPRGNVAAGASGNGTVGAAANGQTIAAGASHATQQVQAGANGQATSTDNVLDQIAAAHELAGQIRATADQYQVEQIEFNGRQVNLVATALRERWNLDRVRFECIQAQMARHSHQAAPAIHVVGRAGNVDRGQVLEACLARQFSVIGSEELEAGYSEQVLEASDGREFRGFSLQQLLDSVIRAAGRHYSGSRKSNEFVEAAAIASDQLVASGVTSMSLSNIFENVLNKVLLTAYMRVGTVWQQICGNRPLSDFKPHGMYRLNDAGGFQQVTHDGQLKHITLTDAKSSVQANTYGAILGVTRQDIINDDLGALDQRATILGRMGARSVEEKVFELLLANTGNFFHTDNANLITPALTFAGLSTGVATFGKMVDAGGSPILVPPSILLTGVTLAETADSLYQDKEFGVGTSAKAQERINNTHKGRYKPVSSPYIDNTAIRNAAGEALSGQSSTAWFLLADPQDMPVIVVGFVNGRSVPYVESSDSVFSKLGFETRAYLDFGVAFGPDKAAAVKSSGGG
ncbi:MAG TPA: hypothetical protein DCQ98_06800 [Planctomycetaceae bacterium]|nr:hypothetical protein [Planctomycetaceae bacterium]